VKAQEVLLSEDFNSCNLPADWTVTATGNPDAAWYVGMPNNTNSDGSSIDGSCMLIFDDDATGENTPAWQASIESPVFDGSTWSAIRLSMDIHFRNYNGAASLQVLVNDGNNLHEIATYQGAGSQTGTQFSESVTLTADLSFFSSPSMSLVIRYDDGNDWAWWAGIDNVVIVGEGSSIPVLLETFNDCSVPDGWETQIESGAYGWQMGFVENDNAEGETSSMNGTCFAYFDDDGLGEDAIPSRVSLFSPIIDGTQYARFFLEFDLILRRFEALENLSVGVQDVSTGAISWAATYLTDMGGPQFYEYIPELLDLTNFRAPSMRLVFQYDDGGGWGWWVGIDNIKLTAEGAINDLCDQAEPLFLDGNCVNGENTFALYTGPDASCGVGGVGSLWYLYEAEQSGIVTIRTNAVYNDLITIFTGSCDNPQLLSCTNYDAYGFTGEELLFDAEAGQTYYIRVHGHRGSFGLPIGTHCIELASTDSYPSAPANDLCAGSLPLSIDSDCVSGHNFHASFAGPQPSLNDKSTADVWYHFETSGQEGALEVITQADFAEVITLYKGNCGALEEVACADRGQQLLLENPENTTYYLQLSSYFATLFGNFCVAVHSKDVAAPENELCPEATPVAIGGNCIAGNNQGAEFSGPPSSCDVYLAASIWYSFIAPPSGKIYVETNADFVHALSVFAGNCNSLEEFYCSTNPNTCNGNAHIEGLQPGNEYFIRISSTADFTGTWESGELCLRLTEPTSTEDFLPLTIGGNVECYDNGKAKLSYYVSGGQGAYTVEGNLNGEIIEHGTSYVVVVSDESGCTTSFAGTVDCAPACALSAEIIASGSNECPEDYQASVEAIVSGGVPPYEYQWQNGSEAAILEGVASGYYTLTVTDSEGNCSAIAGAMIDGPVPYQFEIVELTPATGLNDGAAEVAFSGGTPPYSFAWMLDGELVAEVQNPTNLYPGDYTFIATDAEGCTFEYTDITISTLNGTSEAGAGLQCQLFPNPANNMINLKWQSPTATVQLVSILSASGQLILSRPVNTGMNALLLSVEPYAAGCYFVRLQTDEGVLMKPLVISR
jgi:hypothetical protein